MSDVVSLRPRSLKETSNEIFSGLAKSYDRILDLATLHQDRRWKRWVASRLGHDPSALVLDIGCGTLVLEEKARPTGFRFVGIDISPQMLRIGQAKMLQAVALLAGGDAEFLPFPDRSFDSVVSCYVPKYVEAGRFARELDRVTRPGAAVVLYDFARPSGAIAPFLELYIQGGLRLLGTTLRLARREEAATFSNLPWIIDGTNWDSEVPAAMKAHGFDTVETTRFAGGAVFAYWGRKRKKRLSGPDGVLTP